MSNLTPMEHANTLRCCSESYEEAVKKAKAKVARFEANKRWPGEEDSKLLVFMRATLAFLEDHPLEFE